MHNLSGVESPLLGLLATVLTVVLTVLPLVAWGWRSETPGAADAPDRLGGDGRASNGCFESHDRPELRERRPSETCRSAETRHTELAMTIEALSFALFRK